MLDYLIFMRLKLCFFSSFNVPENEYVGRKAIASGWGTLHEDGKPSCLLQSVDVPVMSQQDCRNTSYSPRMISDNMLCAGYPQGGKDSCQVINTTYTLSKPLKMSLSAP